MCANNQIRVGRHGSNHVGTFEALSLALFLVILQIADLIYTFLGVSRHGIDLEGNLLLRSFMHEYGFMATLLIAKLISVLLIGLLGAVALRAAWIKSVMGGISVIYLTCAIFPWAYILSARP